MLYEVITGRGPDQRIVPYTIGQQFVEADSLFVANGVLLRMQYAKIAVAEKPTEPPLSTEQLQRIKMRNNFV